MRRGLLALIVVLALTIPALASAHVERASYWPNPAADTSISPPTGGAVPKVRGLYSSLKRSKPGRTRVVCLPGKASLRKLRQSIKGARAVGYKVRPMAKKKKLKRKQARKLYRYNVRLRGKCRYHSIQDAVTASHNNDRVVIMPGLYTEPKSRARPTNDPDCANLKETNDKGNTGAVSYAYRQSAQTTRT